MLVLLVNTPLRVYFLGLFEQCIMMMLGMLKLPITLKNSAKKSVPDKIIQVSFYSIHNPNRPSKLLSAGESFQIESFQICAKIA